MMLFLLTKNVQHWSRLGMALGISLCSFFSFSVYNFIVLNGKDPTELVQGPNPNQDVKRNAAIHVLFVALINCLTLAFPFWVVSSVVQFGISVSRLMIFNFCILPVLQNIYGHLVTNFALVQFPVKVIRFTHTGEFPIRE
ncbi:hypothetical protein BC829DRAFT_403042 [Chytridium lagenaria]|nr:hypothetical protein BC829DRAFT_403042 [Chytridium lagenaria]